MTNEYLPLSVVTVSRNAEKTIQRTFDSLLCQSHLPSEYIIIDACSSDRTLEIAENLRQHAPFPVMIVQETDYGISDAFNKGIRRSTQEWVHLLNADDFYWDSSALKNWQSVAVNSSKMIIAGRAMLEKSDGSFTTDARFGADKSSVLKARVSHPGSIVRKMAYDICGLYNVSLKTAMDYEFFLRCETIFGNDAFGFLESPFVGIGYGGESIRNAARGYRELAGAKILHTRQSLMRVSVSYLLCRLRFTTPLSRVWPSR